MSSAAAPEPFDEKSVNDAIRDRLQGLNEETKEAFALRLKREGVVPDWWIAKQGTRAWIRRVGDIMREAEGDNGLRACEAFVHVDAFGRKKQLWISQEHMKLDHVRVVVRERVRGAGFDLRRVQGRVEWCRERFGVDLYEEDEFRRLKPAFEAFNEALGYLNGEEDDYEDENENE